MYNLFGIQMLQYDVNLVIFYNVPITNLLLDISLQV